MRQQDAKVKVRTPRRSSSKSILEWFRACCLHYQHIPRVFIKDRWLEGHTQRYGNLVQLMVAKIFRRRDRRLNMQLEN